MPVLPLVESSSVLAGAELSGALGVGHNAGGRAVFHRSTGIDPLGFGKHLHARRPARDALEAQQRRIADPLQQTLPQSVGDWYDLAGRLIHGCYSMIKTGNRMINLPRKRATEAVTKDAAEF